MYKEQNIEYSDGKSTYVGYYVYNDKIAAKKPVVLVVHDWLGIGEFTRQKAKKLAELGYVGFAVDMYGQGKSARNNDEAALLMKPLMEDRAMLLQRIEAAFAAINEIENVDAKYISAMGFCFGGLVALDLARSGADLKGVVSFHARLTPPNLPKKNIIKAKILALHGYADPMAPPDDVLSFAKEMNDAKANWEMDMYGNVLHSFTNPVANNVSGGMVYNKQADVRSWVAMKNFFAEVFRDLKENN